ncbi:PREDICTED: uncharacterized protein LOC105558506 [Vollenhovia emeryi]|uniref:uncharacterized protein LOC105558506 n=1 Tax=Vollenhovia emeryi TaxID=411798 RepID=UPI0005F49535|nr:PREDICTED: uncharacterized protein LOC105558506 [Vollenhovia emeryi]
MEHAEQFFVTVTQRIFSNWTALRLAVEHDMGSIESARNLCSNVAHIMCTNEGLTTDEVADHLETCMDDHFNTELEDDSSIQVAEELLRFYRYCVAGDQLTAQTEFEKLPPPQSWLSLERPARPTRPVRHEPSSSDEGMDVDKNEQEEDGWTVVANRRSK